MGGLTSFASQAFQVLGAVNTVLGAVNQYSGSSGKRDSEFQNASNAIALQNAENDAALKKQELAINAQTAETERRNALRRAIAKQKAIYGGSGTDSSTGSAQAVLLGKVTETDEDRRQSEALDAIKRATEDQTVTNLQRINTLQLTQLKERNKYSKYTSALDLVDSLGGILK